jgi:predicted nucleic acid-binding protein
VILADTSVWIDFCNGVPSAGALALRRALSETQIVMGDLILAELLQGFRADEVYRKVRDRLSVLDVVTLGGRDVALAAAENYRTLRAKGITIRKTIDVIIATYCIQNGVALLHSDRDFDAMERHLGLRVIKPA